MHIYILFNTWLVILIVSMQHCIVSYNNAFRIMHSLPMRCSACLMFVTSGCDCCNTRIGKSMYSLTFKNNIIQSISHIVTMDIMYIACTLLSEIKDSLVDCVPAISLQTRAYNLF